MKKMTTVLYMYLKVFLISKCRIGLHVNMIRFHYCNHEFCYFNLYNYRFYFFSTDF